MAFAVLVDVEFVLGRRLHGQFGRFRALWDIAHICANIKKSSENR